MQNLEEFVNIEGYEGLYKINKNGDVLNVKSNRLLKPSLSKCGSLRIHLCKDGKKKYFSIMRLKALHFKENLEEFVDVKDYQGIYKINKNGDIFSVKYNKILNHSQDGRGYYKTSLYKNGKKKTIRLHRLIALHFIPNPDNLPVIDHIDRNRTNNNIKNLRWCSYSDNNYNKEIKGCIYKYIDKRTEKEHIHYRVYVRNKQIKQFNTYDEAEEFLKKYLEENENN